MAQTSISLSTFSSYSDLPWKMCDWWFNNEDKSTQFSHPGILPLCCKTFLAFPSYNLRDFHFLSLNIFVENLWLLNFACSTEISPLNTPKKVFLPAQGQGRKKQLFQKVNWWSIILLFEFLKRKFEIYCCKLALMFDYPKCITVINFNKLNIDCIYWIGKVEKMRLE